MHMNRSFLINTSLSMSNTTRAPSTVFSLTPWSSAQMPYTSPSKISSCFSSPVQNKPWHSPNVFPFQNDLHNGLLKELWPSTTRSNSDACFRDLLHCEHAMAIGSLCLHNRISCIVMIKHHRVSRRCVDVNFQYMSSIRTKE